MERKKKRLVRSGRLSIGQYTYRLPEIRVYDGDDNRVVLGSFCSIAENVTIFVGGNHRADWISTFPYRRFFGPPGQYGDGLSASTRDVGSKGDVIVGNDVWIGSDVTIMSGVTIGDGAVLGARSVVARDVRPYAIVVGNPAREVRRRFSDAQISALETIAWWHWPLERIIANMDTLSSDKIESFISSAESEQWDAGNRSTGSNEQPAPERLRGSKFEM